MTRKRKRRLLVDAVLFTVGLGCAFAVGRADGVANLLAGWKPVDSRTVFDVALYTGLVAFAILGCRLLVQLAYRVGTARRLGRAQMGSITVEFVLALPVYIAVYGGVVQMALLANAALVVDYAAFVSARSGIVSIVRDQAWEGEKIDDSTPPAGLPNGVERAHQAAVIAMTPLSPRATGMIVEDFANDLEATLNYNRPQSWASGMRYRTRYAFEATTVDLTLAPPRSGWSREHFNLIKALITDPDAYHDRDKHLDNDFLEGLPGADMMFPPREVRSTVTYEFQLTIPGISAVLAPQSRTIAGVDGRFVPIKASCDLQATAGRRGSLFHLLGGMPIEPRYKSETKKQNNPQGKGPSR